MAANLTVSPPCRPTPGTLRGRALGGATGSTNSDAMALARDGAAEGIVLVADAPDGGPGPAGSDVDGARRVRRCSCSVLLRPPAGVVEAVHDGRSAWPWPRPSRPWPGSRPAQVAQRPGGPGDGADRKLAGILAEADWPAGLDAAAPGGRRRAADERVVVVVGIGVNVNWPAERPADLADLGGRCNHVAGHDGRPGGPCWWPSWHASTPATASLVRPGTGSLHGRLAGPVGDAGPSGPGRPRRGRRRVGTAVDIDRRRPPRGRDPRGRPPHLRRRRRDPGPERRRGKRRAGVHKVRRSYRGVREPARTHANDERTRRTWT